MAKENQKIKKQTVDIIIAPAENIKNRNQFDDNISFQVIPERIKWTEYAWITTWIIWSKNIGEIFRWVRVFICIRISMVHSVHHCICTRTQIRWTLSNIGIHKEYPLPKFTHCKHSVRCVTMLKKCLKEKWKEPMRKKEYQNSHKINLNTNNVHLF